MDDEMKRYRKRITNPIALEYLLQHLRGQCEGTFPRLLLSQPDFTHGELVTLMPDEVTEDRLMFTYPAAYDRWIDIAQPRSPFTLFTRYLEEYLQQDARRLCLLVEVLYRAGSALLADEQKVSHTYEDEIYFLLTRDSLAIVNVEQLLHNIHAGWCALTVMTSVPGDPQSLIARTPLTHGDLQVLAEQVTAIAVSAFDGQGFIIWERRRPE